MLLHTRNGGTCVDGIVNRSDSVRRVSTLIPRLSRPLPGPGGKTTACDGAVQPRTAGPLLSGTRSRRSNSVSPRRQPRSSMDTPGESLHFTNSKLSPVGGSGDLHAFVAMGGALRPTCVRRGPLARWSCAPRPWRERHRRASLETSRIVALRVAFPSWNRPRARFVIHLRPRVSESPKTVSDGAAIVWIADTSDRSVNAIAVTSRGESVLATRP